MTATCGYVEFENFEKMGFEICAAVNIRKRLRDTTE